jgi:hypothetical protein
MASFGSQEPQDASLVAELDLTRISELGFRA